MSVLVGAVRHGRPPVRAGLEIVGGRHAGVLVRAGAVGGQGCTGLLMRMGVGHLFHFRLESPPLRRVVRATDAGQQVEQEGEDVEGEDEGDDPLEHGGDVPVAGPARAREADGQDDLDDDEGQLDPEADAEDAVGAVVDAEALVLGAQEHGGQDVAGDEQQQEPVVQVGVVVRVEDRQEDQARRPGDGADDGEDGEDLLGRRRVGREAPGVSEPPLGHEPQVEEDGGDDGARDEERLQAVGPRVGYVGYRLALLHGRVDGVAYRLPVDEEGEEHAQPPGGFFCQ